MSAKEDDLGPLVRSVTVPRQTNDPDITVTRLDLHAHGFVVRCEVGRDERLRTGALVALELRDSLYTRYEHAGSGNDFVAYRPAIPAEAEWVQILTVPETHVDLSDGE